MEEQAKQNLDRLFPIELFPRMLAKATRALDLTTSTPESDANPGSAKPHRAKLLFPQGPAKPETVPFPEAFQRTMEDEWVHPIYPKHN